MPVEAELKARVREPGDVRRLLDERAEARVEVYRDTYYDRPSGELGAADEELRVRIIKGRRTVLTWKGAAIDPVSGSKPEYETAVDDADAAHAILRGFGYVVLIAFEKRCRNYELTPYGREMLATLMEVPELEGTFLKVEAGKLTTETYTGAVTESRTSGA